MANRTAALAAIFNRTLTHKVALPGIKRADGSHVTMDVTYEIREIAEDWVSVLIDGQHDQPLVIFGAHPNAQNTLRFLLPEAYPLSPYPASSEAAVSRVVSMLVRRGDGGTVLRSRVAGSRGVSVVPPNWIKADDTVNERAYFATLREYMPFQAVMHWDAPYRRIRIRPTAEFTPNGGVA